MNLITFRSPNKIYINDASEHVLRGLVTHGHMWVYVILILLWGRADINLLEFLAQVISIWIDIEEKIMQPLDCLLGMEDKNTSIGWLRRSNFRENDKHDSEWLAKQKVARKLAALVLYWNTTVYGQWFRGAENTFADSIQRGAYYFSNSTHETNLKLTAPSQVPENFKIRLVSQNIISFVTLIL